jgi:hypothetical protein
VAWVPVYGTWARHTAPGVTLTLASHTQTKREGSRSRGVVVIEGVPAVSYVGTGEGVGSR